MNGTAHGLTNNIRAKVMGSGRRSVIVRKGLLGETTIRLSTTTLKTGPRGAMSNAIKYLSVSSSSPIDFEVK